MHLHCLIVYRFIYNLIRYNRKVEVKQMYFKAPKQIEMHGVSCDVKTFKYGFLFDFSL